MNQLASLSVGLNSMKIDPRDANRPLFGGQKSIWSWTRALTARKVSTQIIESLIKNESIKKIQNPQINRANGPSSTSTFSVVIFLYILYHSYHST